MLKFYLHEVKGQISLGIEIIKNINVIFIVLQCTEISQTRHSCRTPYEALKDCQKHIGHQSYIFSTRGQRSNFPRNCLNLEFQFNFDSVRMYLDL